MTVQPSQQTITQDQRSPTSPGGEWQTVRGKSRPRVDVRHHRTTKMLESQRYRDRAGAFRAISAIE